jgi:hypothetical protein
LNLIYFVTSNEPGTGEQSEEGAPETNEDRSNKATAYIQYPLSWFEKLQELVESAGNKGFLAGNRCLDEC